MKHNLQVIGMLLVVFIVSQVVGLGIISLYHTKTINKDTGEVSLEAGDLPLGIERPKINKAYSYIYITAAVIIGTALALLLIRFRSIRLWKTWFFLSILLCLTIAFFSFIKGLGTLFPFIMQPLIFGFNGAETAGLLIALVFTYLKVFRPNVYISNITEVFIYGGLSAIFVPIMDLRSAFILLGVISVYDMYAVWRSKHMIKLATFQRDSQVFAGLSIPYRGKTEAVATPAPAMSAKKKKTTSKKAPVMKHPAEVCAEKTAILGGGDIGFPMFFAGVVMNTPPYISFVETLLIPVCCAISLFLLLTYGKQDRFYPAMPFLSMGCLVGYLLILAI